MADLEKKIDAVLKGPKQSAARRKGWTTDANITILGSPFGINEHFNGFELVHLPTGKTAWIGDGVDMFFGRNERALSPGTKSWANAAKGWLTEVSELYEAYFPELDPHAY